MKEKPVSSLRPRARARLCAVVGLVSSSAGLFAADRATLEQDRSRLRTVSAYADNVLKDAADRYRKDPSPLLANGIRLGTHEQLKWRFASGGEAVICDPALQQNLMRVLVALSNLTGESKYRQAARAAAAYHFAHFQDSGGLLQWGGHRFVDLVTLRAVGPSEREAVHELKNAYPFYELMYEVDPEATARFIRGFWNAHVYDWHTLEISRHGQYGLKLGPLWDQPFDDPKPFIETKGLSFLDAGDDLIYAGAMLYRLAGEKGALLWSQRLAEQYVKARHPVTRLGVYQYTQPLKTASTTDDKVTLSWYGDRAQRQFGPELGPAALEGNMLIRRTARTIYSENALMQLQLGHALGPDGRQLLEWTREGLVAFARWAYIPESNLLRPLLADGTDLSNFVLKRNGYYGRVGDVLEPYRAGSEFLVSYARAFLLTGDPSLWATARALARGNGLGELGSLPGQGVAANLSTENADPFALFAVLDIHRQTPHEQYLALARAIGDNIVKARFRDGYFVPASDRAYANVDAIEPYALLALDAAIKGQAEKVPEFINGSGYLDGSYRFPDGTVHGIHDEELYAADPPR